MQIFSSSFINKVIQFGILMFLTRIIGKNLYGKLSYAQTILNIFLLLEGLGMVSSSLQYCSMQKMEEKKLSYFKYAVKIGSLFNVLIAVAIIVYTRFFTLPVKGSTEILFYFSLIPLMTIFFNEIQTLLRVDFRNTAYSSLAVINTSLYFVGNIFLGKYLSIKGIVIGRYLSYIISIAIGIYLVRNQLRKMRKIQYPEIGERKEFLKYSIVTCLTNATSLFLLMMDTFFVGLIIKDSSVVASYTVASLIPLNLTFIPMSIITFIYPYFARHWNDRKWIKDKYTIFVKYMFIINIIITVILLVFAPYILKLFPKQYGDSITNFRILSVGYLIAGTFRIPSGNIMASMKLVKVNFYNSIITGLVNIVFNIVLIMNFGSVGASISTVLAYALSGIISNIYIVRYLKQPNLEQ
ncbi:oligosaccharide flippase family protein [Clostridium tyrobutyricum]|uniref:oligosaccharide flippase family protein n=1 Tax=Clostridium tyrobutyricum TaxID=1519 RepID=UPI0034A0BCA2